LFSCVSKCRDVHVKCTGYCWCCLS